MTDQQKQQQLYIQAGMLCPIPHSGTMPEVSQEMGVPSASKEVPRGLSRVQAMWMAEQMFAGGHQGGPVGPQGPFLQMPTTPLHQAYPLSQQQGKQCRLE